MERFGLLILLSIARFALHVDGQCSTMRMEYYGQFISGVKVNHSNGIHLQWSAAAYTNNITITYDNRIAVSSDIQGNELLLTFDYNKPPVTTPTTTTTTTTTPHKGIYQHVVSILVSIDGWFRKRRSVSIFRTDDCSARVPSIHITVPLKYTERFCVNRERCFPIKCPLSFLSGSKFSDIPASNTMLFSDEYCTLKKPEFWDEWIRYHFRSESNATEEHIFDDPDKDGLINFLEYYGTNVFNGTTEDSLPRDTNIADIGTNPNNPDTDGDLLLDGFEFNFHMDPKEKDSISDDTDRDGLTNLDEQIRKTNPLKSDTDNDGVNDGEEVRRNTDPLDPSDRGHVDNSLDTAMVKLTIGDHSGSHSERYVIKVGQIEHQSPGFGLVGSGTYLFKPGNYTITIQHVATKLSTPDYDYRAHVEKVSGNATVIVNDPQRLLGYHHESTTDFTIGKSAELIVAMNCPSSAKRSAETKCGCVKSCEECERNPKCFWHKTFCAVREWWRFFSFTCPCTKCSEWYRKEKASDMTWLTDLNANFMCPCRVTIKNNILTEVDNPSNVKWVKDKSCNPNNPDECKKYHPGAKGCLRSKLKSKHGAAQQCCYDDSGTILNAGTPGAGTPDKYYASTWALSLADHYWYDVRPHKWCCLQCREKEKCNYYINELRKGSTDHCPK